jgi:hypothetical protein
VQDPHVTACPCRAPAPAADAPLRRHWPGRVRGIGLLSLVAGLLAACLSSTALAGSSKKKQEELEHLERVNFLVILVSDVSGARHLEAIEGNQLVARRNRAMSDYKEAVAFWRRDVAEFHKARGPRARYPHAPPMRPTVVVLRRSIRGKTNADKLIEMMREKMAHFLNKPLRQLEEEQAARKKAEKEKPPEGNQAANGDFERLDPETRFPEGWKIGQWGRTGLKYYVRADRSNPRSGEHAVCARVISAGAQAGVFTTMRLPAGTYEVRYWASCDVGKTATVAGALAESPLRRNAVGGDWRQFEQTVLLDGKPPFATLKLWSETAGVRVFFDDVEVEAVRPPADGPQDQALRCRRPLDARAARQ